MSIKTDYRDFDKYVTTLSNELNSDLEPTIRNEAASVLKIVAAKHKPASIKSIKKNARVEVMGFLRGKYSINSKTKEIWYNGQMVGHVDLRSNMKIKRDGAKLARKDWAAFRGYWKRRKNKMLKSIESRKRSRGLTQQSWLKLIQSISTQPIGSITPKSARIADVSMKAVTRRGKVLNVSKTHTTRTKDKFGIKAVNRSKLAIARKGESQISDAIFRRKRAFELASKKGVFKSASEKAKRYGGIKVN